MRNQGKLQFTSLHSLLIAALGGALLCPAQTTERNVVPLKNWSIKRAVAEAASQAATATASTTSPSGLILVATTPCRLVDTRAGSGYSGAFGTPSLTGMIPRTFTVPASSCGLPAAAAYSLYIVSISNPGVAVGWLDAWSDDIVNWPGTGILNAVQGGIVGASAIVGAGADGGFQVMASSNTDLVIDVNGYFIPRSSVNYRGLWNAATSYAVGDVVAAASGTNPSTSGYIAAAVNINVNPASDVLAAGGNWNLLASAGAPGPAGPAGPAGATGATGLTGPAGPIGLTGATGPIGLTGPAGAQGPAGDTGPAGAPGLVYRGAWAGDTNYAAGDVVYAPGRGESATTSYVALAANTNENPTLEPAASWGVLAVGGAPGAVGAAGPQGPIGLTGAVGATGATGATGLPGLAGPIGLTGPAGVSGFAYVYNDAAQVVANEADLTFNTDGFNSGITFHAPNTASITIASTGAYLVAFSVSGVEPNQFTIFVNGALAPGTTFGSGAGTQQNTGQVVLSLAAGDNLTLRNHTSVAAVTLQTLAGGTQTNVNASITILKLNDQPIG